MALRAFRCNPALGGFGNETEAAPLVQSQSSNKQARAGRGPHQQSVQEPPREGGDAFAQIVKELVDNAVDGCSNKIRGVALKRVRVTIEKVDNSSSGTSNDEEGASSLPALTGRNDLLRVTVCDNGCGMEDIEKSVSVFSTSKADDEDPGQGKKDKGQIETAGRYGIGLTLCLLHAQRLVPNSCAMIKSTTPKSSTWTVAKFVVDTNRDSVVCVEKKALPKKEQGTSGTAVSLLVPVSELAFSIFSFRSRSYFAYKYLAIGRRRGKKRMATSS